MHGFAASLALLLLAVGGDSEPPAARTVSVATADSDGKVVIADSNELVFRASQKAGTKMLSDLDREDAAAIMSINRTRGTWQTYLLYTEPEMRVPASRPGFIITLPPPSKAELERRRKARAAAERADAASAPEPAPEPPASR